MRTDNFDVRQQPLIPDLAIGAMTNPEKIKGAFKGTSNPRQLRVLHMLQIHPMKREETDRVAGASNSPELIAELRRMGLHVPCYRAPAIDRDGRKVKHGVYYLTDDDKAKINNWKKSL